MSYSFEYIDIILLAMIAGFIFLRLRGILGKRTGFEGKVPSQFEKVLNNIQTEKKITIKDTFDEESQKEFLKGAKIAYETIITDFSDNDNKLIASKPLLSKKIHDQFEEVLKKVKADLPIKNNQIFDDKAQKEFINGAKIAYETIITDFSDNDNKITSSKSLLNKEIYNQFNKALKDRSARGHYAEITFIGVNSAKIKEHKKIDKILNVTVDFIAEVITCIRDKDKRIVSGDPEKIKKIYDTWVFSRDTTSANPNWQLVNILT